MKMKTFLLILLQLVLFISVAHAEKPIYVFEPGGGNTNLSDEFLAWHPQFEDNGDYGESWFFLIQTDDGGALFAMISITNLGIRTFDGRIDAQFYAPDGQTYRMYSENKRDAINASNKKMDIKVGKAHAWGGGRSYHMTVDEDDMKFKFDVKNNLPPYTFGKGKVDFYEDRSAEWSIGLNTPRGRASGSITVKGKTYDLAGNAYHDHGWSTIKMPDAFSKWYTVRLYHEKYSLVMHQQFLNKKFGGKINRFGVFGTNDKLKGSMRNFSLKTTKKRKDSTSKYNIPVAFDVSFKTGKYSVKGKIAEERFLDSIDVLGQVSWPIRVVIKAFYSKPYLHRYWGRYELDVTGPDGKTEHISGLGIIEANYF